MSLVRVALPVILLVSSAVSKIHYVRPADSPASSCPGQPCLTLHEYAQVNNFTNGTTLQFLPGNHSIQQSLRLVDISNVTLEPAFNHLVVNIICMNNGTIYSRGTTGLHIVGLTFTLGQRGYRTAITFVHCKSVFISDTMFQGFGTITGGALSLHQSKATIFRCVFQGITSFRRGAIGSTGYSTNINIHESSFISNVANDLDGGAITANHGFLLLNETIFDGNSGKYNGGAISCELFCRIEMIGNNTFHNNSCHGRGCYGGAITCLVAGLTINGTPYFGYNHAAYGGAISLIYTNATFSGKITLFKNSAAYEGGVLCITTQPHINKKAYFVNVGRLVLMENSAEHEGGALFVKVGNVTLDGNVTIANNKATIGGGIRASQSDINVLGKCFLAGNRATYGGAMNTYFGTVSLRGPSLFSNNTAVEDGGAIYAAGTRIQILHRITFGFNMANGSGGALYFENRAYLYLSTFETDRNILLVSSYNYARHYGGLMYHKDSASIFQCSYPDSGNGDNLSDCFIQIYNNYMLSPIVMSNNDSSGLQGSFLFGGLLNRCTTWDAHNNASYINRKAFSINFESITTEEISSQPYSLCYCTIVSCQSRTQHMQVYRGQKFTVPLLAEGQAGTTPTIVTAITSSTARLDIYQTSQQLPDFCFPLTYTVYSTESHERVVLYPDGPCRDTGTARVVIDVTLLPCPDGFTQSGEICTCEDRLHDYPVNRTIADTPYLTKKAGLNIWIGAVYVNDTYQGFVLCKSCPAENCKKGAVNVTIDNPDMQCDFNRSGLLCGACAANHSLMLGSSKCQVCPNTYLALLLPFAGAGVALVVFLTSLRLTVATGTLNSVLLYANILQVKRNLFFPQNTRNLLTVFLAWMNLDLGFQTCFYDGLDAYALNWLQFAFPLYVWLIIGLMIFISRYSITASKLIGSNPVAVLATLLLTSYTKILKIVIEVYSYENMDYPDNNTVPVWLKDANVPYVKSKHLFLTVVTSLVLVFLFLPYTLLLLLGHKLYRFTGKKHWHWLNRLKPLLDSYYAPYKNHTRYWTGFLLLVRCALYVIFSLSSARINLLAITLTFSLIGFIYIVGYFYAWRIYKSTIVNLIEACVYLNLVVLSVTALTGQNAAALVYSLVGLVFVVMIALIAHQFHLLYISKTALWLRLKNKWPRFRKQPQVQTNEDSINPSHDPHKLVTKTVIELREPLLDN